LDPNLCAETLLAAIPPGSKVLFLDYPHHMNIGDHLITKGTECFFANNNISVVGRFNLIDFPDRIDIHEKTIIVLQGGGNFGDLYPQNHKFREAVVRRFPDHRIVVLPQTAFFQDDRKQLESIKVFSEHQHLVLFARDSVSASIMQAFSQMVFLAPDMAHYIGYLPSTNLASDDTLYLLRRDNELNYEAHAGLNPNVKPMDWPDLYKDGDRQRMLELRLQVDGFAEWYKFMDYGIDMAIKLFSQYRNIVTSRLHGFILSQIMRKDCTLVDNNYGKNSSYIKTWYRS
jgi:pyruvyl transferase EpsO